jgi:hypothetical protein
MVSAEKICESDDMRINKPLSSATLRKIQEAAVKSPHLKGRFKDMIRGELKSQDS